MLPVIFILLIVAVAADAEREVKSISVNHQRAFKKGTLAVVHYTLEFTAPIQQRIYKINNVQTYLDEHELKEINGKYTYFVVFPVQGTPVLRLDVICADGPTSSVSQLVANDSEYFPVKDVFTGAKYGEKCNETTLCVTDKTDCDAKMGICSCRQGYQWDSATCK